MTMMSEYLSNFLLKGAEEEEDRKDEFDKKKYCLEIVLIVCEDNKTDTSVEGFIPG